MEAEEKPPIHIVVPDILFPDAAAFLRAHGCTVNVSANGGTTTVTLPTGSIQKLLPGRTASERHSITLADGTGIHQVYDPSTGHSALFIPAQRGAKEGNDEPG